MKFYSAASSLRRMRRIFLHALCPILLMVPQLSQALNSSAAAHFIREMAPSAGVVLTEGDKVLLTQNAEKLFIAASCTKVPLVLSAFRVLGADFRFKTFFYTDAERNLLIRGAGDPLLTSEELVLIATRIKQMGYTQFRRLYLDDSLYQQIEFGGIGDSANPYDAQLSSLFVNFNTMNLSRLNSGKIVSAEPQTPTLALAQKLGTHIPCCNKVTRINLGGDAANIRNHTAQLLQAIFAEQGIGFRKKSSRWRHDGKWQLIYTHSNSHNLIELSEALLLYSNNLIANALLLQFATDTRQLLPSALAVWRADLGAMGIPPLDLYEGSGLDRRNRFTPMNMLSILNRFIPYSHLLPADRDGAIFKTGTLQGVSNAAGYSRASSSMRSFVIFSPDQSYVPILNIIKRMD